MKRDNVNYLMVGLFVLLMLALLVFGLLRINGGDQKIDSYYTHFRNVSGIKRGAAVAYQGFEVGHVDTIEPVEKAGLTMYRLKLDLQRGWKVRADSSAIVTSSGLLSGMLVEIREGKESRWLQPGAEIAGLESNNLFESMAKLSEQLSLSLSNDAKPLLNSLNRSSDLIAGSLGKSVPESMQQLQTVLKKLDSVAALLATALGDENLRHVRATLKNVDDSSANFLRLTTELSDTRKQLDLLLADTQRLLAHNRPEVDASIGELHTVLRSANTVMQRLEGASLNAQELTRELRQNPSLLIQSKPAGEPSEENR